MPDEKKEAAAAAAAISTAAASEAASKKGNPELQNLLSGRRLEIYTNMGRDFKLADIDRGKRGEILDFFTDYLWGVIRDQGIDSCDDVIAVFNHFYEKVIVPIDIPRVPNFIEPVVEEAVRRAVVELIKYACANIELEENLAPEVSPENASDSPNL